MVEGLPRALTALGHEVAVLLPRYHGNKIGSVLVSSAPFGSHKAIAIEPSSQNFAKLKNNAEINGNRFDLMKCAIGDARGVGGQTIRGEPVFRCEPV